MWFLLARLAMKNSKIPYIILNVVRALNILCILACMLAAGSLLVKTSTLSLGWFNIFDLAEKVLIIVFGIVLLITETPKVLERYIEREWPKFGKSSGFLTLGFCLLFLGCNVLSYLTKEDADKKHLGGDFYRMCQAAGLMAVIMSFVNMIATIFLQDRKSGMTAREVRGGPRREFLDRV